MLLIMLAVVASGFEMLGAAMVYVLLALVVDPGNEIELPLIGDVRELAGDIDERTLLLGTLVAMGLFFLLCAFVQVGVTYVQQRVAQNAGARLSNRLVEGYLSWPYAMHLHRSSSELIRNGHQAVKQLVSQVFVPVIRVSAEVILVMGMLVLLISIAPAATGLAAVVIGGAAALVLLLVQPRLKRLGAISHATSRETLSAMQQALHGVRDIKLLGRERYFARRYGKSRLRSARADYLNSTLSKLPHAVMELAFIGFILLFFGLAIGTDATSQDALSVLGLFAYAGLRIQPSLQRITGGLNNLKYSTAPLTDLHADLRAVEQFSTPADDVDPLPFTDAITLRDVSFKYEGADRDALTDVNLTIQRGQEIGICGPTGGGKTTLVDIITGLLTPTVGHVNVDGHDLREDARRWQRNLGIVPQSVFLTDDTLRRNIALGIPDKEIDDDAIRLAVQLAQLTEFIDSLPDGLETTVGERGIRLSGGQRQRIVIARALYNRPAVLVFDEGTSALDNATEAALMGAIESLRGDRTIIHIAHRLSTVQQSDCVVLIEKGQVCGMGSFEDLQQSNAQFQRMAGTVI